MVDLLSISDELPEKFMVLGQKIKVEYVDNLVVEGERCEGGCYVSERVIKIDASLINDTGRLLRVIRHEVMHMRIGLCGLSEILDPKEAICVLMESL